MKNIEVRYIHTTEAEPFILNRHYAHRMCSISHAFGAYDMETENRGNLIGVVTYGMPASPSLCVGVCGEEWKDKVLELNRLCCDSRENLASYLVGTSLRMLPKPLIIVSYADTAQGHVGYIYQATNFIYTGLSAKRTDVFNPLGKHSRHTEGLDTSIRQDRSRKHRYIYICAHKRDKKTILGALNYKAEPYPKGDSKRYDTSKQIETQMIFL
jgi:hypothetical protein